MAERIAATATLLDSFPENADKAQIDMISADLRDHQRWLNESSASLPSYDIRRYQDLINTTSSKLAAFKQLHKPKSKFSFKSKSPAAPASSDPSKTNQITKDSRGEKGALGVLDDPGALTVQDTNVETINLSTVPALASSSSVTIQGLQGKTINLKRSEQYASISLRDLSNSTIDIYIAATSLFIENCHGCNITGEAQQFRIHACKDCTITYRCRTGRPVIEGCSSMLFKNLQSGQETIVDDFSDLSGNRKNWNAFT